MPGAVHVPTTGMNRFGQDGRDHARSGSSNAELLAHCSQGPASARGRPTAAPPGQARAQSIVRAADMPPQRREQVRLDLGQLELATEHFACARVLVEPIQSRLTASRPRRSCWPRGSASLIAAWCSPWSKGSPCSSPKPTLASRRGCVRRSGRAQPPSTQTHDERPRPPSAIPVVASPWQPHTGGDDGPSENGRGGDTGDSGGGDASGSGDVLQEHLSLDAGAMVDAVAAYPAACLRDAATPRATPRCRPRRSAPCISGQRGPERCAVRSARMPPRSAGDCRGVRLVLGRRRRARSCGGRSRDDDVNG
jgi:hypothetical protein